MTVGPVQPGLGCAATPTGLSTTTQVRRRRAGRPARRPASGADGQLRVGQGDLEPARRRAPWRCAQGCAPSDGHVPGVDQIGGGGAREAEQPGDRDIEPEPVQTVRDRQQAGSATTFRVPRPSSSMPSTLTSAARIAPHTIAESATLKIGQYSPSGPNTLIQSTTCPRPTRARGRSGRRGCPVRRREPVRALPPSATQRIRLAVRMITTTTANATIVRIDREAGAERERSARVAGLVEIDRPAEDAHRRVGRRQLRGDQHLRDDVEDQGRGGDRGEQPDAARRTGRRRHARRRCRRSRVTPPFSRPTCPPVARHGQRAGGGQRRSSRCLQATSRVATGNALSRAFGIGLPQLSQ